MALETLGVRSDWIDGSPESVSLSTICGSGGEAGIALSRGVIKGLGYIIIGCLDWALYIICGDAGTIGDT